MPRYIDADAFCGFLREVSTRQHYETLLTKKDRYPTVADVIEEICCDLDGTSLNGFDNAPTVEERPKGKWELFEKRPYINLYMCSNCGHIIESMPDRLAENFKGCYCGADMRGDV